MTTLPGNMRALLKQGTQVSVRNYPVPACSPGEILVKVACAGICRTDFYVAEGKIDCADPVVLGHEFSGVVAQSTHSDHKIGNRVAVMPRIPCDNCEYCQNDLPLHCTDSKFLGLDRHGAFAEFINVPATAVYPLPEGLSFKRAAYAEPVAAALAALKADINPQQHGLLLGSNRIAELTSRILKLHGFNDVRMHDLSSTPPAANLYDFVIETQATTDALQQAINCLKPGGILILKSRQFIPVELTINTLVQKELRLQAVNYGSFEYALELLADPRLAIDDLLGEVFSIDEHEKIFNQMVSGESQKLFFGLDEFSPG